MDIAALRARLYAAGVPASDVERVIAGVPDAFGQAAMPGAHPWVSPLGDYATNRPTYPGGDARITVDTALRFPNIIARRIIDLAWQRFVADRIFARGTDEQVRGGAAVFSRSEALQPERAAEQVETRSEWPRTGFVTPEFLAAQVGKFGLEAPVHDDAVRRNALDDLGRAQRKLANAVVSLIDGIALTLILTDADVPHVTGSGDWSTAATDIPGDLATARAEVNNSDLGYELDTLVIHPDQELDMLLDAGLREILPREGAAPRPAILTGQPVPILGLRQILVSNRMTAGKALLCQAGVVGTIADETPLPQEGYITFNPAAGPGAAAPIYIKRYREERSDETIVRAARFSAMWIAEPGAAVVIDAI